MNHRNRAKSQNTPSATETKYGIATVLILLAHFQIVVPYADAHRMFMIESIEISRKQAETLEHLKMMTKDIQRQNADFRPFCVDGQAEHQAQRDAHRTQIESLRKLLDSKNGT